MKKHLLIVSSLVILAALFSGCRRMENPMPETMPTRPLATVTPSYDPTWPETTASTPMESLNEEPTIEDGNGPIPSQKPDAK